MAYAQAQVAQAMVSIGQHLHAPLNAILAALCIGAGENTWETATCNPSNHCGIYQLSSSLQAEHAFTDYVYWTYRAYQSGFWGYGGLIKLANAGYSVGAIANGCQGAYGPGPNDGAFYYNQFTSQAATLYNRYKGTSAPSAPVSLSGGPTSVVGSGGADFSSIQDAILATSAGDVMGPGTGRAAARAHHGYVVSHDTLGRFMGISTFDKHDGH